MRTLFVLLAIACSAVYVLAESDFYQVLGVSRKATVSQIKKAYRTLSLEAHPDKAGDSPEVLKRFQEISEAYQILSDAEKREIYDRSGHEGLKQASQQQQQQQHNPFDMFSSFFGGGRQQQSEEEQRGTDIELSLPVSLEDLYLGKIFSVVVRNQHICPKCGGSGARSDSDVTRCHVCGGKGHTVVTRQIMPGFVQQMQATCEACGGKGKVVKAKCPSCSGRKVMTGRKTLSVRLEMGAPDGHQILLENEGDESPDRNAGHIGFRVRTVPHARFERRGDDLHMSLRISLREALLGVAQSFEHLDKHVVRINKQGITRPDEVLVVKDEGMPRHSNTARRGNLHVRFVVDFPPTLSEAQKAGFAAILP